MGFYWQTDAMRREEERQKLSAAKAIAALVKAILSKGNPNG